MIRYYKISDGKPTICALLERNSWGNIFDPSGDEIRAFSAQTGIPYDFLLDPLDIDERARIEVEDEFTLVVLHTPWRNEESDDFPFATLPLGIILTHDYIVTVCREENEVLENFIEYNIKNFNIEHRVRFMIQIFHMSAILFLKYLKEINQKTGILEAKLHKSMKNEELLRLVNIEKSLVYFITSLQANEIIMARMLNSKVIKMTENEKDLLEDAHTEYIQAIHMTKIYSNILSGLMDAFASIISNNLNAVMKFLTAVTIILMIPNLIASVYGMNVDLPFQSSPNSFLIVTITAVVLCLIGIIFFWKKKWF